MNQNVLNQYYIRSTKLCIWYLLMFSLKKVSFYKYLFDRIIPFLTEFVFSKLFHLTQNWAKQLENVLHSLFFIVAYFLHDRWVTFPVLSWNISFLNPCSINLAPYAFTLKETMVYITNLGTWTIKLCFISYSTNGRFYEHNMYCSDLLFDRMIEVSIGFKEFVSKDFCKNFYIKVHVIVLKLIIHRNKS